MKIANVKWRLFQYTKHGRQKIIANCNSKHLISTRTNEKYKEENLTNYTVPPIVTEFNNKSNGRIASQKRRDV